MKTKTYGRLIAIGIAGLSQAAFGDVLLLDGFPGRTHTTTTAHKGNPTSTADWSNAGVPGDLSDAAGGTLHTNGDVYSISGLTLTTSVVSDSGWAANTFPDNQMLNDLWNIKEGTATVSLGGFQTAGTANTLTTDGLSGAGFAGLGGNTFTLEANQDYTLYLFGVGNDTDQNTTFTFDGIGKSTVATAAGLNENGHFVTYDFTTAADLTGFTLDFSFANNTTVWGSFNGLALVTVPETSSYALIGGCLALTSVMVRRRRK
jgi:hypothetical protein